jgi:hypothetical protein
MTVQSRSGRSAAADNYGGGHQPANLGDILERVLDRGLVIVGDIRVSLLDIELLTIKLRLLIASVDTARELGIDWWEHDPWLSSKAKPQVDDRRRPQQVDDRRRPQQVDERRAPRELSADDDRPRIVDEEARTRRREHEPDD